MPRRHVVVSLLITALSLALVACERAPSLSRLDADARMLAFGDSLTYGTGAPPQAAYPAVLAERTGFEVVNAGVPGELSGEGRRRLPGVLDQVRPDLLILCHGGNDILRNRTGGVADNLRAMIAAARERGVEVVLVGVPRFGLGLSTAPWYEEVAVAEDVPLVAGVLSDILSDAALKSDRVHPNARGYARLGRAVHETLVSAGALPE